MSKRIDWYYHRKGCQTCGKMDQYLAGLDVSAAETVNASKERLDCEDALKLAREASRIIAARGKSVVEFDLKNNPPDDDTLLKHLLGPTGNLRAPTIRIGKTLLVGFHPEAFGPFLTSPSRYQ
jgi:arsenate reductase-like glutaredoxin family protein